jgi:hypothetical protein
MQRHHSTGLTIPQAKKKMFRLPWPGAPNTYPPNCFTAISIQSWAFLQALTSATYRPGKSHRSSPPRPGFYRTEHVQDGRPYQDVTHHLLKWRSVLQAGGHKIGLQLAAQYNAREEFDIVRSSSNKRPQIDLNILTLTEDLTWEHQKKKFFSAC